jgi:hypothetical protein
MQVGIPVTHNTASLTGPASSRVISRARVDSALFMMAALENEQFQHMVLLSIAG